jgi:molybdate transport system substrate-binding protein
MAQGPTVLGRVTARSTHLQGRRLWAGTLVALSLVATLVVVGCGGSSDSSTLHVLAASSLTEAFTKLGAQYEAAHPGVNVVFDFAGSQDLVAQLNEGAPADVLACADTSSMQSVADLVGSPQTFAGNTLAIVVPPGNPQNVRSLADLARPGLKVVLAAPEVPAGKYAQQILDRASVTVKPVSLEESVKGVVTKVSLGEADAGVVYVTDVSAADGKVDGVTIPAGQNVAAVYPIATVDASEQPARAQDFVALVTTAEGQKTLQDFGFLPSAAP